MVLLAICNTLLLHDYFSSFCVIHINHQLRAHSATEKEHQIIKRYCSTHNIALHYRPLSSGQIDAVRYQQKCGLEAAARIVRMQQYVEILSQNALRHICTAHHSDDNCETVLMRMLQGAGVRGLTAIKDMYRMHTERYWYYHLCPLHNIEKKAIYQWARYHSVPYQEDGSNQDTIFLRNAVRNDIIPHIARYFPQYRHALQHIITQVRTWQEYINQQHRAILQWEWHNRRWRIATSIFFNAHISLQIQSFFMIAQRVGGNTRIPYRFVMQGIRGFSARYCGNRVCGYGVCCYNDTSYLYMQQDIVHVLEKHRTIIIGTSDVIYSALAVVIHINAIVHEHRILPQISAPFILKINEDKNYTIIHLFDTLKNMLTVKIKKRHCITENARSVAVHLHQHTGGAVARDGVHTAVFAEQNIYHTTFEQDRVCISIKEANGSA